MSVASAKPDCCSQLLTSTVEDDAFSVTKETAAAGSTVEGENGALARAKDSLSLVFTCRTAVAYPLMTAAGIS